MGRHRATPGDVNEGSLVEAPVAVEGEGVEARVVWCGPGLVDGDDLAFQAKINPGRLETGIKGFRSLLEGSVGVVEGVDVAVGVVTSGAVAADEDLDGGGGGGHAGEEQGSERHCECVVVAVLWERRDGGSRENIYTMYHSGALNEKALAQGERSVEG